MTGDLLANRNIYKRDFGVFLFTPKMRLTNFEGGRYVMC